jgi:hypothetical protein
MHNLFFVDYAIRIKFEIEKPFITTNVVGNWLCVPIFVAASIITARMPIRCLVSTITVVVTPLIRIVTLSITDVIVVFFCLVYVIIIDSPLMAY